MKKGTRVIPMFCAIIVVLSLLTVSAFASNHSDVGFEFWIYSAVPHYLDAREKTDTTPVYLNITTGNHTSLRVAAMGCDSEGVYVTNCTCVKGVVVDYVTCTIGTGSAYKYSIHSLIYENGYRFALLKIWANDSVADYIGGKWSPDSVGTYNYATQ